MKVLRNLAYGPHGERNHLDLYLPDGGGGEAMFVPLDGAGHGYINPTDGPHAGTVWAQIMAVLDTHLPRSRCCPPSSSQVGGSRSAGGGPPSAG